MRTDAGKVGKTCLSVRRIERWRNCHIRVLTQPGSQERSAKVGVSTAEDVRACRQGRIPEGLPPPRLVLFAIHDQTAVIPNPAQRVRDLLAPASFSGGCCLSAVAFSLAMPGPQVYKSCVMVVRLHFALNPSRFRSPETLERPCSGHRKHLPDRRRTVAPSNDSIAIGGMIKCTDLGPLFRSPE